MTRQNLLAVPVLAMLLWGGHVSVLAQDNPAQPTAIDSEDTLALEQANRINGQAEQLYNAGRYSEAEVLLIQALEIYRKVLGNHHPQVAASLNDLAVTYTQQGQYLKAEPLHIEALEIRRKALGNGHLVVAHSLNELALMYEQQEQHQKAEPLYIEALEIRREALGNRHPDVATSLNNLAVSYREQGQYSKAEPLYIEALEIRREIFGNRHPDVVTSIHALALIYGEQGQIFKAERLLIEALDIGREVLGNYHPDIAKNLHNLAYFVYEKQRQYIKAESLYLEALGIVRKNFGNHHLDVAINLQSLANFYFSQGQYTKSEPLYIEALEIRRKILGNGHPNVVSSLINLADSHRSQGKYAKAEPLYIEALEILRETPSSQYQKALSLNNLALLYEEQRLNLKAEPLYIEALEILRGTLGDQHEDIAMTLNNLAILYDSQGQHTKAESLYIEALEILRKTIGSQHPNVAINLGNLGLLYVEKGDYKKAEPLYIEALEIRRETLENQHPHVADSYIKLAHLYERQGLYEKAEPLYLEAIEILRDTLGDSPFLASGLNGLALLYGKRKRHTKAKLLHMEALEILREIQGNQNPDVAKILSDLALVSYVNNEKRSMEEYFREALEIQELNLSLNLANLGEFERQAYMAQVSKYTHITISLHQNSPLDSSEFTQLALTTLIRRKGRIQDVGTNNLKSLRQNLTPDDQTKLEQWITLRQQMAALTFNPPNRPPKVNKDQFDQLTQQAQTLEAELARRSAAFRAENEPVEISSVQQQLPANSVLVEYIRYRPYDIVANEYDDEYRPDRYAAYLLFPDGRIESRDLGEATQIDAAIQAFSRGLRNPLDSPRKQSQALEQLIIDPIRPFLNQSTHLLIAPDSQLHTIPFEALQQEDRQYLVEQFQISYLNSGRDLLTFDRSPSSQNPAVIVADPDYSLARSETQPVATRGELKRSTALKDLRFRPLPGTAAEANSLAKLLPNAQVLTASEATENRIKQLQAPRILHIATHGFFLANTERTPAPSRATRTFASQDLLSLEPQDGLRSSPSAGIPVENPLLRSGLALAGFNPRQSGSEDGVLTALEASTLNLFGTDLVVLSACETGLGDIANGEGVYGLRRAFTIAGAETQVISLWQVDDFGTQSLMTQYYEQLLEGKGRSDAMRQSQLAMIESGTRYAHPYYWAPFIVSGDWRAMPQQ